MAEGSEEKAARVEEGLIIVYVCLTTLLSIVGESPSSKCSLIASASDLA